MFLLYKPFIMNGSHCGGKSFQVETKQPFLFFSLWPWTPGRRPGERQFDYFHMSKDALETVAARKLGSLWSSPSLSLSLLS